MALHLIMRGCTGYMEHLKRYHQEQEYSVGDRGMYSLTELKMCKLDNYDMVPTPEEIREMVARCIAANDGYARHFIYNVREEFEMGNKHVPSERDNGGVLKVIRAMQRAWKGKSKELTKKLYEILKMPASAVGACHSFHSNDMMMLVAMRQFGIGLLIVKDDNEETDDWPYQSTNYLSELGSRLFLPLVFGMIHLPKDGNMSILRRRCNSSVSYPEGECFAGYALEMKTIIRTENVNLLTGVFDLSYTSFADYIHGPKYGGKLIGKRDYRSATYGELKAYRVAWDAYQAWQQDQRRANERRRARAAESKGKDPPPQPKQSTRAHSHSCGEEIPAQKQGAPQAERDMMKPENKINSYIGKTDEQKKENRDWYINEYYGAWHCLPEPEDLDGQSMTIGQSLRLMGETIVTVEKCNDFFDDSKRAELIKRCRKWWKNVSKFFHADKFNLRVLDAGMRKENDERFSALTTALKALEEWSDLAIHKERRPLSEQKKYLQNLHEWRSEIHVPASGRYMDYDMFQQPKREKR
jgi:hypothetical protein